MEVIAEARPRKEDGSRVHRPCVFDKMEALIREMQDPEGGVPVRSQKQFLVSIPLAFMGYDLIEWLMERLSIEESEAVHIANLLCQHGYFFPVNDSKMLTVKDDSSLYRFQTPYYWPWQNRIPDNVEYAIYLAKRSMRNKQRHALEEYEIEALNSLRKNLQNKWDMIQLQADEQVRLSKERKKGDKIVNDSQERAFWRVYRPPPGCPSSLEVVPVSTRARLGIPHPLPRRPIVADLQRKVDLLRNSLARTRIKVSSAIENVKSYFDTYMEYDPMIVQPQPSNPWITEDQTFWQLSSPLVEIPTEKRVRRWALSTDELMSDPTGLQEFTNYLKKEYSHENIRFWMAVKDLRRCSQTRVPAKVNEIFEEFLAAGAPCEINIDGKTMEKVHQELKNPSRFAFDSAAKHVYELLLKKDCYPRFIRSEHYKGLMTAGIQPLQRRRFFGFGGQARKKVSSTSAPTTAAVANSQQQRTVSANSGSEDEGRRVRRRRSDKSLSGSAHELAVCGVGDLTLTPAGVPHSHSQSNLTDIPYRGDLARFVRISARSTPGDPPADGGAVATTRAANRPEYEVCPWDAIPKSCSKGTPSIASTPDSSDRRGVVVVVVAAAATTVNPSGAVATSRENSSSGTSVPTTLEASGRLEESDDPQRVRGTPGDSRTSLRNFSALSSTSGEAEFSDTGRPSVSSGDDRASLDRFPCAVAVRPPRPKRQITSEDEEAAPASWLMSVSTIANDSMTILGNDVECEEPSGRMFAGSEGEANNDKDGDPPVRTGREETEEEDEEEEEEQQPAEGTSRSVVPARQRRRHRHRAQRAARTAQVTQEQRDNNINEVCPWEDEESCRVDAPYVKIYATLGYL